MTSDQPPSESPTEPRRSRRILPGCQMPAADRQLVCSALLQKLASTDEAITAGEAIDTMHGWALVQYGRSFSSEQLESCVVMALLNMLAKPLFAPFAPAIIAALYEYNFGPSEAVESAAPLADRDPKILV